MAPRRFPPQFCLFPFASSHELANAIPPKTNMHSTTKIAVLFVDVGRFSGTCISTLSAPPPSSVEEACTCIGRKKPTSRPHCDTKSSQRLPTLHLEGDQNPLHPNLGPAAKLLGLFPMTARRFPPRWSDDYSPRTRRRCSSRISSAMRAR